MNYVRAIPGRYDVPLKYIIRDNDFSNLTPNKDFLDDYVNNEVLQRDPLPMTQHKYIHLLLTLLLRTKNLNQLSRYTEKKEMEEGIGKL